MSTQTLREFVDCHTIHAAAISALSAALDARASGVPLDPVLAERIQELLGALGAGQVLEDVSAEQARGLVGEIRQQLRLNAKLVYPETRGTSWSHTDPHLLQEIGEFSRGHAHMISRNVVPALDGMAQRLGKPGAAFLDIGVGVAGTAMTLAELWPAMRVVGLDVWQPALALARENVAKAGLSERIELREQGVEHLEDDSAFDLAWMPTVFIPERVIPAGIERTLRALRRDGWLMMVYINLEGADPISAAFWRLRLTTFGGPNLDSGRVEQLLRERGFADVRSFPRPPGVPIGLTVGRRA